MKSTVGERAVRRNAQRFKKIQALADYLDPSLVGYDAYLPSAISDALRESSNPLVSDAMARKN